MSFQQKLLKDVVNPEDRSHERHYQILVDGKDTVITRVYRIPVWPGGGQNELRYGDEKFDMTAEDTAGWEQWIMARLQPPVFNMEQQKSY